MIKLLITDLDNTLYDWVDYFVPSFLSMIEELSIITTLPQEELKTQFKKVNEKYKTVEYPLSLQELECFMFVPDGTINDLCISAIDAFKAARNKHLKLYDGVRSTLEYISKKGIKIVGLTDSVSSAAIKRLRLLDVERLFDGLVSIALDGDYPKTSIKYFGEIENDKRKPNKDVIDIILADFNVGKDEVLYIGDNLNRDTIAANQAGIKSVHASYGDKIDPKHYKELLKITHWTKDEFKNQVEKIDLTVNPDFTVKNFSELIEIIDKI